MTQNVKDNRGRSIAVVVPTRNRPEKLASLLQSLSESTCVPGLIVIVSSGDLVTEVVEKFADQLSLVYKHSEQGGQVHQRNLGLREVPNQYKWIACFDDDIIFAPDAIEKWLDFAESRGEKFIGASMNMVNATKHSYVKALCWLGLADSREGVVMKSGTPTTFGKVSDNIQTEYLNGGTTIWLAQILRENPHSPIDSSWAVYEDVLYSYPLRDKGEMWVIEGACVEHHHVDESAFSFPIMLRRVAERVFWRYLFVTIHKESMSRAHFAFRVLADIGHGGALIVVNPKRGAAKVGGTLYGLGRAFAVELDKNRKFSDYYSSPDRIG